MSLQILSRITQVWARHVVDEPFYEKLRQHLEERWGEFEPIIEQLKNKNPKVETIWNGFSRRLKKRLADAT